MVDKSQASFKGLSQCQFILPYLVVVTSVKAGPSGSLRLDLGGIEKKNGEYNFEMR